MSILSERRTLHPYGMEGGEPGETGKNLLIWCHVEYWRKVFAIDVGERLVINTPGGGGYGKR
eukprot:CCRYP_005454-RA/>CCRYP_005454-RA protein AED:0.48 eAED:0.56 QI:0/0/0/1/0/0/2/0/61